MTVRRTLFARLATVIFLLFAVSGLTYIALTVVTARQYADEVNQQLQHDLASQLMTALPAGQGGLAGRDDLRRFLRSVMAINPTIEVYLLDLDGRLTDYVLPEDTIRRRRVDLDPVRRFLDGDPPPILGDDPRSDRGRKVFSAARVTSSQMRDQNGYLYVILGGQDYESALYALRGSYILRISAWAVFSSLLVWVSVALISFNILTRRLSRLTRMMEGFQRSGFSRLEGDLKVPTVGRDEIDRLAMAFKMMVERIVELLEQLRALDLARREFITDVAHDLRAPLASLKAYVGTLVDNQGRLSPDEQRRYLDIVGRQTERLDRLISDLLQLSVLESEDSRLSTEPFAVSDLVQDVFLRFRLPAEQRGVAFDLVLPDAFPYVQGDISLIERVIENLVENALRHTSAGGRVTVALQADQDRAEVQVTDTGRGIKEHDLPFIFDRQFRGAKTMDAVSVGLGLAIAKRIVELHGSALHVTSTVGEGSTFSFALPRIEPR